MFGNDPRCYTHVSAPTTVANINIDCRTYGCDPVTGLHDHVVTDVVVAVITHFIDRGVVASIEADDQVLVSYVDYKDKPP